MNPNQTMRLALMLCLLSSLTLSCRSEHLVQVPPCEPQEEVCDGSDNDCDGQVDEYLFERCDSACGAGQIKCTAGKWSECNAPLPKPETCNGKDDDCDGLTDEDEEVGVTPCYPGNQSDLAHGECRFGVNRCIGGGWVCQGAVTPHPEDCNGKDDDCDGQVDEGSTGGLDLVFAVDYSGSMTDKIDSLRAVTAGWASKYASRADLRMALVGIPSDTDQTGHVTVMLDLSTPPAFATELNKHTQCNGSGNEASLDAVWQLAIAGNPLGLHWTSGNRRALVIYTDEPPQSYLNPVITQQAAQQIAQADGLRVFVFTSDPSWYGWGSRPFSASVQLEADLDDVVQQGSCR